MPFLFVYIFDLSVALASERTRNSFEIEIEISPNTEAFLILVEDIENSKIQSDSLYILIVEKITVYHFFHSGIARKPPQQVMDQLRRLNDLLKIGQMFCRSRSPDFLLDIIQRQVRISKYFQKNPLKLHYIYI